MLAHMLNDPLGSCTLYFTHYSENSAMRTEQNSNCVLTQWCIPNVARSTAALSTLSLLYLHSTERAEFSGRVLGVMIMYLCERVCGLS